MSDKILFVDDEPNVLQSISRSLRGKFELETAEGGEEALAMLKANGGFAVIVSDMRMPGMNGVEFLTQAKSESPDTVRMMLTGNADQQTAADAVNHGDIFRFLNKPCQTDDLEDALNGALRQHQLITAEKELLEKTLRGSIKALADVLSLTNPEIFGHTTRYKNRVRRVAEELGLADLWKIESVAMLSQIGCVTVAEELVKRKVAGDSINDDEFAEYAVHAKVGSELLMAIPRMEDIAQSIQYQEKNFDGSGYPVDSVKGEEIPLGARLMKVVLDFDAIESSGATINDALDRLKKQSHFYDPAVLEALEKTLERDSSLTVATVTLTKLTDATVLAADVRTSAGVLLVAKGQETTASVRRHLRNYLSTGVIGDVVDIWESADQ